MKLMTKIGAGIAILIVTMSIGFAQTEAAKTELAASLEQARKALVHGPTRVDIPGEATLDVPVDDSFIPPAAAGRYLRALGNTIADQGLIGMIVPNSSMANWFAVVQFQKSGYIRDDDARSWSAADLLKRMQENTERGNASRRERGLPEFEVTGWAEPPSYDAKTHRLVWSSIMRNKGATAESDGVNYRTLVLGRDGYVSITMVTSLSAISADKPVANGLLANIDFLDGKRYADFNSSTDHVAEYGLAALIIGVGAKKLGLLALAGAFLLKFFKLGLVALVAFGAAIKRFFKRQPKPASPRAIPLVVDGEPRPDVNDPPKRPDATTSETKTPGI